MTLIELGQRRHNDLSLGTASSKRDGILQKIIRNINRRFHAV